MKTLVIDQVRGRGGRPVYGHKGPRYSVSLDGEMIVKSARDPEHTAARELQRRGFTGSFQTTDSTGRIRMVYPSIEEAAKWTVQENEDGNPTFELRRYHPFPGRDEDIEEEELEHYANVVRLA